MAGLLEQKLDLVDETGRYVPLLKAIQEKYRSVCEQKLSELVHQHQEFDIKTSGPILPQIFWQRTFTFCTLLSNDFFGWDSGLDAKDQTWAEEAAWWRLRSDATLRFGSPKFAPELDCWRDKEHYEPWTALCKRKEGEQDTLKGFIGEINETFLQGLGSVKATGFTLYSYGNPRLKKAYSVFALPDVEIPFSGVESTGKGIEGWWR
jgi:hypothetical protein